MYKYTKKEVRRLIKVLNKSGHTETVNLPDKQGVHNFLINRDFNRKCKENPM